MALKLPEKSPLPSQIPSLSDLSRASHEVPQSGCHGKWIKQTDSACLRLAKQEGRIDLLKHYTPVVMKSPPAAYAAPGQHSHCAIPPGLRSHGLPPCPLHATKEAVKLPPVSPKYPSRMPAVSTDKEFSGANELSFPPVPAQRKSEAVNFRKLISNGYGTDWFRQCSGWEKKIEETSENSEHSEDSELSESPPASNQLKPPFQGCNK